MLVAYACSYGVTEIHLLSMEKKEQLMYNETVCKFVPVSVYNEEVLMKIEGMNKSDWLMLVLIAVVMTLTDFNNLQTIDYVLIVSVVAWLIMLGIRLYVVNVRNKR